MAEDIGGAISHGFIHEFKTLLTEFTNAVIVEALLASKLAGVAEVVSTKVFILQTSGWLSVLFAEVVDGEFCSSSSIFFSYNMESFVAEVARVGIIALLTVFNTTWHADILVVVHVHSPVAFVV